MSHPPSFLKLQLDGINKHLKQFLTSLCEQGWQSVSFPAQAENVIPVDEDTGNHVLLGMVERTGGT